MLTKEVVQQLFQDLGEACGFRLILVEGSYSGEGPFTSATARSWQRAAEGSQLCTNLRAQLLITANDDGEPEIWALVFFYINGVRAAPAGESHLTLCWETGDGTASRWMVRGWEADIYDEWTESDRMDDDD